MKLNSVSAICPRCTTRTDLLITTEAMVAEKPKRKVPSMPPGSGMGDDF